MRSINSEPKLSSVMCCYQTKAILERDERANIEINDQNGVRKGGSKPNQPTKTEKSTQVCSFTQTAPTEKRECWTCWIEEKRQSSPAIMTPSLSNWRLLPMAAVAMLSGGCSQSAKLLTGSTWRRRRIRRIRVSVGHHVWTCRDWRGHVVAVGVVVVGYDDTCLSDAAKVLLQPPDAAD